MEQQDKQPTLRDLKDVEYYSALVQAWIGSSIEASKTLIALSSAGIGLLITLITTSDELTPFTFTCYIVAIFSFVLCCLAVLTTFHTNTTHLEEVVSGKPQKSSKLLSFLDTTSYITFTLGLFFTLTLGILTGAEKLQNQTKYQGEVMTNYKNTGTVTVKKSLNGISNMAPVDQPPQASSADSTTLTTNQSSSSNQSSGSTPSTASDNNKK